MKMRNLLFGIALGLLAVVHSTPVNTVSRMPDNAKVDGLKEAEMEGYLVPSHSTTESTKTNTTVQPTQQTSSVSEEVDAGSGVVVIPVEATVNFTMILTTDTETTPQTTTIPSTSSSAPVVFDDYDDFSSTTMSPTTDRETTPVPPTSSTPESTDVPSESSTLSSSITTTVVPKTTPETSTFPIDSTTSHIVYDTWDMLYGSSSSNYEDVSSTTPSPTTGTETTPHPSTSTSPETTVIPAESTSSHVVSNDAEILTSTNTPSTDAETTSQTTTIPSTTSYAAVVFDDSEGFISTTMSPTADTETTTLPPTSTTPETSELPSESTSSHVGSHDVGTSSSTSSTAPETTPQTTMNLFEGSADAEGPDMFSSARTETSTASSTSTDAANTNKNLRMFEGIEGSGLEIKEVPAVKINVQESHRVQIPAVYPSDAPGKGHSTPGWVIITGFIAGVAALVMLLVAIATRDKWNRASPPSQSANKTNSSNQQREVEMETFLNKDSPRENGKAAEYTVIPLDELPEKYSSH